MKKQITQVLLVGCMLLVSSLTQAGPVISGGGTGDMNGYFSCQNDEYSFFIRGTAVPTLQQGVLKTIDGQPLLKLYCKLDPSHFTKKRPAPGQPLRVCVEHPAHDGSVTVTVERNSDTGLVFASVVQKQTHPLEPKVLGVLNCQ